MRKTLIAASATALSLTATLICGAAANASDTTDGPRNGQQCNAAVTIDGSARIAVDRQNMPFQLNADYDESCISSIKYTFVRMEDGTDHGHTLITRGNFKDPNSFGDGDQPGHYLITNGEVTGWDYMTSSALPDAGTIDLRWNGRVSTPAGKRSHGTVTLSATATHFRIVPGTGWGSSATVGYVKWGGARVAFQKQTATGWVTVKTTKASKKGLATAKIKAGRSNFRAVVADSSTAWGATSSAIRK